MAKNLACLRRSLRGELQKDYEVSSQPSAHTLTHDIAQAHQLLLRPLIGYYYIYPTESRFIPAWIEIGDPIILVSIVSHKKLA